MPDHVLGKMETELLGGQTAPFVVLGLDIYDKELREVVKNVSLCYDKVYPFCFVDEEQFNKWKKTFSKQFTKFYSNYEIMFVTRNLEIEKK